MNAFAHVIGFVIELALIFLGEMSVVSSHIFLFIILKPRLALFKVRSLDGREFTTLDSVRDTILLPGFAAVNLVNPRMAWINHSRAAPEVVLVVV